MKLWVFLLGFGCGTLGVVCVLSGLALELTRFANPRSRGRPIRWGVWVCHTLGLVAFPLAAVALMAFYTVL